MSHRSIGPTDATETAVLHTDVQWRAVGDHHSITITLLQPQRSTGS